MVDLDAPLRFLRTAYQPDDWVAIFLKSYETGRVTQRVGSVSLITATRFQAWLRAQNASFSNVYVSVNTFTAGQRARTRQAVRAIRHVFLEADHDGLAVLDRIGAHPDLPPPSYVLHSSPQRVHIFWRVTAFGIEEVEGLQKQLALELGTDPAATPGTQCTRLPGFLNHKYRPAYLVTIEYGRVDRVYTPANFPRPRLSPRFPPSRPIVRLSSIGPAVLHRARQYVAALPPAIAGQHGDLHTFRVCCRLVRGFALADDDALDLLAEWNARCGPPWSDRELKDKIRRARRYGREPIGGLIEMQR